MKKRFTILIAAIAAIMMMGLPGKAVGQTRGDLCNYNTFNGWPQASYANSYTYTNSEGEWGFTGAYRQSTTTAYFQIKKNTSNFVLTTPTFAENIGTVTVTFTAGAGTVYVKDDSDNSLGNSSFSSSNPAVIDISSSTVKKIKICVTENNTATCQLTQLQITDNSGAITQTLTFGFSSNPGDWPTSNSTTLTNYDYTLNAVTYTFALKNVKCNSGYLMMTNTAALGLPAIANYKLIKVVAKNTNGCSTSTRVGISSSSSSATYISGGAYQTWSTQGSSYTYNLSSTSVNTVYYMYVTNANAQVTELKLTYEYVAPNYTVTFDCGEGATGCPDDIDDIEPGDNNFTVPNDTPTKDCYTFDGFYYNAADDNDLYEVGETYTIDGDLELVASWALNKYTVTYYSNNGETGEDVAVNNLECGSAYTIADNPGFTQPQATPHFVNWNTAPNGSGQTYTVGQGITISGNLSLYAQWSAVATYTVTYAPGTGATGSNVVDNNVSGSYTVRANDGENGNPTFSKEGYTFKCWNNGSNDVNAGSNITVSSNVTLTAQWLENLANPTFTVTGVSNGTANTYYVTANIEIEQEDGAYIYYTTDGSDPTDKSTEYTAAFTVTNSCTIKAIAIFEGYADSEIVSQEIIIVQPNVATFTNGVYASLNTEANYNTWYKYNVSGDQVWSWASYNQTYYAKMSGYASSTNNANEDWLISPKMTVTNGKLAISFDCAAKFGTNKLCSAQYSTDYPGYGDPSGYTWTKLIDLPTANNYTFEEQNMTITGVASDVYVAIKYVSTTSEASTIEINNFTAKQCYPITYYANGGSGTTADANSPYAVGAEVTILENAFTAPTGKEFTRWNTQSDGYGTTKNPGNKITMTTAGYELYAIWGNACVLKATMNATTGEAVYDYNSGNKRFNINLSSSVDEHGGCNIFDYGFVYSTSVATPTVGADNCTKVQIGDSQPDEDDPFETTLTNVTKEATYYVRSYATNAAGTAYSDVISVEVPANFPTWTISYTTNGEDESTTTSIFKGAPISGLLAAPEQDVPSGYTFMGWYGSDYDLNNEAPTFVKNGDAINSNLALKAVFAIQTGGGSADTYSLVENVNDLHDGDIVVLYSTGSYTASQVVYDFSKANGGISNNLFSDVDVTVDNNQFTSSDVEPMTLVASGNSWKLQIGNQYVSAVNKGVSLDNTGSLNTITISDGTATITATISSTNYRLQYNPNNGNGRFAYYSSTQKSVKLFKQNTPTYSSYCTAVEILSGNISGNKTGACAIHPTSGATIKSGTTLTAGALGNTNAAKLVIEDGGQLNCPNAVVATIKKNIDEAWDSENKTGWYTISTPTGSTGFGDVANLKPMNGANRLYDIYRYKESTMTWENSIEAGFDDDMFEEGRGYLYRKGNTSALEFAGPVNIAASYVQDLSVTGETAIAGFALLGNPYSHNINLKHVTVNAGDNLDACYILSGEGAWGASIGNTADIAPCTGFLVQATADCKATINKSQARDSKANADYIQFIVANNQYEDVTFALFDEGHGLNKINHRNSNIQQIYIPKDGESFAVATMADNTQSFNLNFKAMTMGQYKLSFKAKGEFNYLHVIDRMTGEDIDMLLEGEYSFIGSPQDNEARFIVRLGYLPNYDNNGEDIFAYQNGSDVIVSGEGELQIFDVMGRMVSTQNISGTEKISVNAQGVYVLRLVGTEIKTQKIVVR